MQAFHVLRMQSLGNFEQSGHSRVLAAALDTVTVIWVGSL